MWILAIGHKGGYTFHSLHRDKATAEAWQKCKEHDGADCTLVEVSGEQLDDLAAELDKFTNSK